MQHNNTNVYQFQHLIQGLEPTDFNSTLIVVFVGETDLEYVVQIAHKIEMA